MKITKIIQRDLAGRTIVVECPNCGGPLALRPSVITNLEEARPLRVLQRDPRDERRGSGRARLARPGLTAVAHAQ